MATQESQESPPQPMTKKKKLEFGVVIWQFNNIQHSVRTSIQHSSPIFKIGKESECQWVLKLDCKLYEKNHERIYLYLKRCVTAEGPEKVPVSFRFGFKEGGAGSDANVAWAPEDKQYAFKKEDKQSMLIPGIDEYLKNIFSTTEISIYCAMTALYGERLEKQSEGKLLKLSDDFLSIFKKERMPDQILTCKDGTLKVHKAILAARSYIFENMLTSSDNELNFPNVSLDMTTDLISFVYSGNWDVLFKDFVPTKIKDYARTFGIPDLYEKMNPDEIVILHRNDCERVEYTWVIENFSLLKKGQCISSPTFRACSPELSKIPINMTASMVGKKCQLVVALTCFKFKVICEACIIDATGKKCFEGNFPVLSTAEKPAQFTFNINKLLLENRELYLPRDTLTIICSVTFHKDKDECAIRKETCMRVEDPSGISGVERLAKDMENLLKTRLYSDLSLATKKKRHKVHKVILANRPSDLQPKIASLDRSTNILTVRLPEKEVESLIQIAYTGSDPAEKSSEVNN